MRLIAIPSSSQAGSMPRIVARIQLKPETLKSFEVYVHEAEAAMEETLRADGPFLWSDNNRDRARRVRGGEIVAQFWSGNGPVSIPSGLIHDWVGTAFIPGTTVQATLLMVQDYDHHQDIYKPEVIASRLMRRRGSDFEIYLRLLKKKILTVVLDTDHDVHYQSLDAARWFCRSHTTRIAEVQNAGTEKEEVSPPDNGYGFLWRLYSYWRFQERDHGVYVECRAISLTRDVPLGLGWMIEPIIQKLPRESLIHTLECTREALLT
jgi:hypothetical protein